MNLPELFGWIWILAGMASGAALGMCFMKPDFLGGYASHQRRLLRLGHISFFGLGILNLFVASSLHGVPNENPWRLAISVLYIVGGLTMPLCCMITAFRPRLHALFAVPVLSLISGTVALIIVRLSHCGVSS